MLSEGGIISWWMSGMGLRWHELASNLDARIRTKSYGQRETVEGVDTIDHVRRIMPAP